MLPLNGLLRQPGADTPDVFNGYICRAFCEYDTGSRSGQQKRPWEGDYRALARQNGGAVPRLHSKAMVWAPQSS
jgi:hypothetical protein